MDSTALRLCMDNGLPIVVFNMSVPENIRRVLRGERVGTIVTSGAEREGASMIKELMADGKRRMESAVEALRSEFNTVRTGRASTGLLDRLHVDYYGAKTPLKQLANLATPDPRTISITVYDKGAVNAGRARHPGVRPGADAQHRRHGRSA